MADFVDALDFKLQSKICYHRGANLDYLETKAMVDKLVEENKRFRDEKMEYLDMINTVIEEKKNLQHDYQVIKDQVAPIEEELETVKKELAAAKELHVAAKHEHVVANQQLISAKEQLVAAKHENVAAKQELLVAKDELVVAKGELVVAKDELVVAEEQLARKTEELEILRKKVQESEAMHTQLQQQKENAPDPELVHFRMVTGSSTQHVVEKEELVVAEEKLARKNEELEVSRKMLQESEARHTQLRQQKRSAPVPEPVHFRRVTRSTYRHEKLQSEIV